MSLAEQVAALASRIAGEFTALAPVARSGSYDDLVGIPTASGGTAASTVALDNFRARLSARAVVPCRIGGAGSSTMAGNNATTATRRVFNRVIARTQDAYPSGTGSEPAVIASPSASFGSLSTAAGVHGYNAGEGGTTAATYLTAGERTSIAGLGLALQLHIVGSNDYATGVTPAAYKTAMQTVLADLQTKRTVPCVDVLVHAHLRTDVANPAHPWSAYGAVLAELAAANPDRVVAVDVSGAFARAGAPATDPLNLLDTDGVHLTDIGLDFLADQIVTALGVPIVAGAAPATGTPGTTPPPVSGYSFYTDPALYSRWDAASLSALANGAPVTSWAPAGGSETAALAQATTAQQPSYTASVAAIGGKPAVTFASDFLDTGAWSSTKPTPATVFGVVQVPAAAQTIYTGRNGVYMYSEATTTGMAFGAGTVGQMLTPTTAGWKVFCMVYDGTSSRAYVSAATPVTGTTSTTSQNANAALPGLKIGTTSGGTSGVFNGAVAEIGVIGAAVADDNVRTALQALAAKYGLSLAS